MVHIFVLILTYRNKLFRDMFTGYAKSWLIGIVYGLIGWTFVASESIQSYFFSYCMYKLKLNYLLTQSSLVTLLAVIWIIIECSSVAGSY